jgi:DNA-binding protein Alba
MSEEVNQEPKKEIKPEAKERKQIDDNVILVGEKPMFTYCNAVRTVISKKDNVIIKTRGKFISKAVNVVEIAKRQNDLIDGGVKLGSQSFKTPEGKDIIVSTFEATLKKK